MDADAMEAEPFVPVVFGRSSKKRKIYRQRGAEPPATPTSTTAPAVATTAETGSTEGERASRDTSATTAAQPRARPSAPRGEGLDGRAVVTDEAGDGGSSRHVDDAKSDAGSEDGGEDGDGEGNSDEDDAVGVAVAELIRRRKQRKPRIGGVEFRADSQTGGSAAAVSERGMVPSRFGDLDLDDMDLDDLAADIMPIGERFAPPTGLIGDLVNKHMEEYVEAQLAKRHQAEAAQQQQQRDQDRRGGRNADGAGSASGAGPSGPGTGGMSAEARQQLAMKGKLHEIDLGAEARARNIAMTAQATQRLRGAAAAAAGPDDGADRPRLGRDGQPAPRARRGSDDLKRDQMVEQFLHENKMDVAVYDVGRDPVPATEGRPTDDRIAEQFRREFMEAVAQRMRRKRRPLGPPAKPKARNEEEILKGPKLGGSRNVRSIMRDKLLQKQEEKRQSMPKYEQQLQEQKRRANRRR